MIYCNILFYVFDFYYFFRSVWFVFILFICVIFILFFFLFSTPIAFLLWFCLCLSDSSIWTLRHLTRLEYSLLFPLLSMTDTITFIGFFFVVDVLVPKIMTQMYRILMSLFCYSSVPNVVRRLLLRNTCIL